MISILMNSIPMTRSSALSRKCRYETVPWLIEPRSGSSLTSGYTLMMKPNATMIAIPISKISIRCSKYAVT